MEQQKYRNVWSGEPGGTGAETNIKRKDRPWPLVEEVATAWEAAERERGAESGRVSGGGVGVVVEGGRWPGARMPCLRRAGKRLQGLLSPSSKLRAQVGPF